MSAPQAPSLSKIWRRIFLVELPIVGATLVYWMIMPADYLRTTLGMAAPSAEAIYLLYLYAGTVGSLVFYFYARVLLSPPIEVRTFRYLQEGLFVGDVIIVALGFKALGTLSAEPAMAWAQIGMATFWGITRLVYLVRSR